MDDIKAIVGLITGVISIFTFLTGVKSLELLKVESRPAAEGAPPPPPRPPVYVRSKALVWLTFLVFLASLAVTLAMGLSGGDVEGAVFVMLLLGGIAVIVYVLRFRHVAPLAFGAGATVALGAVGFMLGSVSRGEEATDAVAGIVIGLCITVIAWMFRAGGQTAVATPAARVAPAAPAGNAAPDRAAPPAGAHDADRERAVLQLAADSKGEVTVSGVALKTQLSLDEARTLLESLAERGFCERSRTDQGATVYRFADFA